ncbi:MAG: hypothetical protein V7711_16075 [Pseudomonadales bacterium]
MLDTSSIKIKPWRAILNEIDLPVGTAIWVLAAHFFTLISPAILIWFVWRHEDFLAQILYEPRLFYIGAVLMMVGSTFEIAQNAFDRWYLTEIPPSFCDCLFGSFICLAVATNIVATSGSDAWVWYLAYGLALVFPTFYLLGWPMDIARGLLGIWFAVAFYQLLGESVIFLPFVSVFLTLYFLGLLLATHAQSLHGFTTGVNALGMLCTPWAISNAANASPVSWFTTSAIAFVVVGIALAVKPRLKKLSATARRVIE